MNESEAYRLTVQAFRYRDLSPDCRMNSSKSLGFLYVFDLSVYWSIGSFYLVHVSLFRVHARYGKCMLVGAAVKGWKNSVCAKYHSIWFP